MKKMNQKKKLTKKTAGAKLMMFLSVILFIVSGILPLTCNPFTVDVMWGQKKKTVSGVRPLDSVFCC